MSEMDVEYGGKFGRVGVPESEGICKQNCNNIFGMVCTKFQMRVSIVYSHTAQRVEDEKKNNKQTANIYNTQ